MNTESNKVQIRNMRAEQIEVKALELITEISTYKVGGNEVLLKEHSKQLEECRRNYLELTGKDLNNILNNKTT